MAVPIIEKYVIMRHLAYTKRHQRDMAEWMSRPSATEQGYWDNFNATRERSEQWFARESDTINGDPNMNYRDRASEIIKLADRRVYPAWSGVGFGKDCGKPKPECQHAECAFLRTYVGDAAASEAAFASNQAQVAAELLKLEGPDWNTTIDNKPAIVPMSGWELTLFAALTNPQDGSVPVPSGTPAVPLAAVETTAPASNSPAEIAGIPSGDVRYPAMQAMAERICQFCGDVRKTLRGKVRHEPLCKSNPAYVAPSSAEGKKLAEEARAAAEEASDEEASAEVPAEEPVMAGGD